MPDHISSQAVGHPPGTLIHVGEPCVEKTCLTAFEYDESAARERTDAAAADLFPLREAPAVTWISVVGLRDIEVIEALGARFNLHPLVLEDILNTSERPKMEDYGDYVFFVLKTLLPDHRDHEAALRQVSLVLGPNFVLSFEERPSPVFDPVRDRLRKGKGRIRNSGADYLAYVLIDCIVDGYFGLLEKVGGEVDDLEEALLDNPGREMLQRIHALKREMILVRKSIWPFREVVNNLEKLDTPLIRTATDIFLRDVYDHIIQIADVVETYRDILAGMLETYLSSVSNRMNEIMKVLTIIATIFIPLTFIVGVYGMNFRFMPELTWRWGYFAVWAVIAAVAAVMLAFFKRKKWL